MRPRSHRTHRLLAALTALAVSCAGADGTSTPAADQQDPDGTVATEPDDGEGLPSDGEVADDHEAAGDDAAADPDGPGDAAAADDPGRGGDGAADGTGVTSGDVTGGDVAGGDVAGDAPAGGPPPCTSADTALAPELPAAAERVGEASGDLDGDGEPDRVLTYAITAGEHTTFHLRVVTAAGYVVEANLDQATAITPVQPLGTAALGGTREVALIVEDTGASGVGIALWGLHAYDDLPCALRRVTIPDHTAPLLLHVGGSVGAASGLACDDVNGRGALLLSSVQRADPGYEWTRTTWHWPDAGALVFAGEEHGSADALDELEHLLGLDCPGVDAPTG